MVIIVHTRCLWCFWQISSPSLPPLTPPPRKVKTCDGVICPVKVTSPGKTTNWLDAVKQKNQKQTQLIIEAQKGPKLFCQVNISVALRIKGFLQQKLSELKLNLKMNICPLSQRWTEMKMVRLSVSCQSGEDWIKIGRMWISARKSWCQRWPKKLMSEVNWKIKWKGKGIGGNW